MERACDCRPFQVGIYFLELISGVPEDRVGVLPWETAQSLCNRSSLSLLLPLEGTPRMHEEIIIISIIIINFDPLWG